MSSNKLYVDIYRSFLKIARYNGWSSPGGVNINSQNLKKKIQGYEWYDFDGTLMSFSYVPKNVKEPQFHTVLSNVKKEILESNKVDDMDELFDVLRYFNSSYDLPLEYDKIY